MKTRGSERLRPSGLSTRRFIFLTLLLLAVAAPAGMVFAGEHNSSYIVVFKNDAVTQSVAESGSYFLKRVAPQAATSTTGRQVDGARVRKHVSEIRARIRVSVDNVFASALGGFSANLTYGQRRALERDPAVAAVVPDEDVTIDDGTSRVREAGGIRTTAKPRSSVPAGIRRVGAQRNARARASGDGNRINADVAVIDTGIERDHPDLNVVGGYNCTSRNRDKWDDEDGHGTHVAGIIGAKDNSFGVVGVAPGVRLWSVRVLGPQGSGRISWLICGIDWVTSQRDKGSARAKFEVANMSLSFGLSRRMNANCNDDRRDAVHQAICRSVKHGTTYVVAAGNESHNAKQNRPAAYDEVITVSAMADYDGRGGGLARTDTCPYWTPERDDGFATFSNYGGDIDLVAPGRCVLSTYPRKKYAWMSGTSMASPHVAGAAAVYKAIYPNAKPAQVRMALKAVGTRDWRTGTDPDQTHEKAVWIGKFRTMPDFAAASVVGTRASRVFAGSSVQVSLGLTRVGGFDDPITVALADAPDGFKVSPITTSSDEASLRIRIRDGVAPGSYRLTLVSSSSDVEHAVTVVVHVVTVAEAVALEASVGEREGGF